MNRQDELKAQKLASFYFTKNGKKYKDFDNRAFEACLKMSKWKEQQMIEKACNWFEKNWTMYTYPPHLMFEDFKKYMEEN